MQTYVVPTDNLKPTYDARMEAYWGIEVSTANLVAQAPVHIWI